ncbi:hypothetical protein MTMBA_23580 [Moorella thermoacetica]
MGIFGKSKSHNLLQSHRYNGIVALLARAHYEPVGTGSLTILRSPI